MFGLIKKIVGTKNDREVKRIRPYVVAINALEDDFQKLSDADLKAKTDEFKKRISEATEESRNALQDAQAAASAADIEERVELTPRRRMRRMRSIAALSPRWQPSA